MKRQVVREEPPDWSKAPTMTARQLERRGFGRWDEPDAEGRVLMLIPRAFYGAIPRGLVLETVMGRRITFEPGKTCSDHRLGFLAYGLRVRNRWQWSGGAS